MNASAPELAVLFADISGSTRLYEVLGDAEALAIVDRCLALIGNACEDHGGRMVKTLGDEAMAVFPLANLAAQAATAMQRTISGQPAVGRWRPAIRVGIHFGPALEADGDVLGEAVSVAARMVAFAKAQQVVLSPQTAGSLAPWLRTRVREIDTVTLGGTLRDMSVFELNWAESDDELTQIKTRIKTAPARLRLRHGDDEFELGEASGALSLGRESQNDVIIADRRASRVHARIERQRDKFVLIDESSNGTYVTIEGEAEVSLRHEGLTLRGRGHVSFGHAFEEDPTEVLAFSCVD